MEINELKQKFQRDINRCSDSDRNIRKKGLQKLLLDLPWETKQINELNLLKELCFDLFNLFLNILSDLIEKCREYSINILKNIIKLFSNSLNNNLLKNLIIKLCSRVGEIPYPEQGEELRLQIIELLYLILFKQLNNLNLLNDCADNILLSMSKGFQDSFPAVKRCWSDIIILISKQIPFYVHLHHKSLLKGLLPNSTHQHHKVRSVTINVS